MYCKKCGKEIDEDYKICPYCMTPVNDTEDKPADSRDAGRQKIIIIVCAAVTAIAVITAVFLIVRHNKTKPAETLSTTSSVTSVSETPSETQQTSETTTTTTTTTATTTTAKPKLTPTGSDWQNLADLSEKMYFSNFNYKSASVNDVFELVYFNIHMPLYEDLVSEIKYNDESFTIPVKNFNWLCKNVFNIEPKTVDSFIVDDWKAGTRSGDNYIISTGATGFEYPVFEIKSKDKNSDGTYNVVFNVFELDMETGYRSDYLLGTISATVELKEVDGKRFWSIYKIVQNLDY